MTEDTQSELRRWPDLPAGPLRLHNGRWSLPFRAAVLQVLALSRGGLPAHELRLRVHLVTDGRVNQPRTDFEWAMGKLRVAGVVEGSGAMWDITPTGRAEFERGETQRAPAARRAA